MYIERCKQCKKNGAINMFYTSLNRSKKYFLDTVHIKYLTYPLTVQTNRDTLLGQFDILFRWTYWTVFLKIDNILKSLVFCFKLQIIAMIECINTKIYEISIRMRLLLSRFLKLTRKKLASIIIIKIQLQNRTGI